MTRCNASVSRCCDLTATAHTGGTHDGEAIGQSEVASHIERTQTNDIHLFAVEEILTGKNMYELSAVQLALANMARQTGTRTSLTLQANH